jgi:citrate/tricarballylate utilization protein
MPHDISLLAEAQRQFLVCSACRYCEGYCATFPAIEGRTSYTAADVAYIANLCHDCRACAQACMYTPPHEFAVDIPKLLGAVRLETYQPRANGAATLAAGGAALALLLVALAVTGRWEALGGVHAEPGAFYAVVPFPWMLVPALLLAVWALVVLVRAGGKLIRAVAPEVRGAARHWLGALHDGLALTYMRGGGDGCYYPEPAAPSSSRRLLHVVLVAGVGLAFASTLSAAFAQDVVHVLPPYPLWSVPVVLGTLGGIGIVVGAFGLLSLKARPAARAAVTPGMTALDVAFLVTLLVVAVTGLLLLALRGTALLGTLLVVHLAAVAALFVTAPYGKFLHVPLRLAALFVFRVEESRR